jgi:Asp-tRNA(Asn)/Glu-tRNA(Gln) amidotransferase A subunit family amidase
MGAPFSEGMLLDIGEAFQRATSHHAEHATVA